MKNPKNIFLFEHALPWLMLALISGLLYLPLISKFGYFNDDWYLMYAAGAKGAAAFRDIFIIDRPLRTIVMAPIYSLFGPSPLWYNLSAYVFRVLSAFSFYWFLNLLWDQQKKTNLIGALVFLIYPGFLSQPNAIDYQSHIVGLAAGMWSVALTLKAVTESRQIARGVYFFLSIMLGWLCLGQMEWYIGLEALRWAGVFLLVFRGNRSFLKALWKSIQRAYPSILIGVGFLFWRVFIFKSQRGATDVDLQLGDILADPFAYLVNILSTLVNDVSDVLVRAWYIPLKRLTSDFSVMDWGLALGIAFTAILVWFYFQGLIQHDDDKINFEYSWWEPVLLGSLTMVFGLLPVELVGRSVDFSNYSRYSLVASVGVAILFQACIGLLRTPYKMTWVVSALIGLAAVTHIANGLMHVRETEEMRNFWWQVSWRIPQMEPGTTLLANYPDIVIEEDYFVWGPASLIYYPESLHEDYPQPGIYAVLVSDETVEKILAKERQEFSERRSIRTYPNYRNVLIISQPTADSCVHVISGTQPEISSSEDERYLPVYSFSEDERIKTGDPFHIPLNIPFGSEPSHDWCFYYQSASLARQAGDWDEVVILGEQALTLGYSPVDQIEWLPFVQAYAVIGQGGRLLEIDRMITDDAVRLQGCALLSSIKTIDADVTQILCDP